MSEEKLEVLVGQMLTAAGLTVGLAESCTGGLICSRMTDVPGSSAYVIGGLVTYSYEAKESLLGVQVETLLAYGAVSEEAALEMARGARQVFEADIGIGVTGIAGPGGGMPCKPVGLVHIALAAGDGECCRRHVWDSDRVGNKMRSADAALRLIQSYLQRSDRCRE